MIPDIITYHKLLLIDPSNPYTPWWGTGLINLMSLQYLEKLLSFSYAIEAKRAMIKKTIADNFIFTDFFFKSKRQFVKVL